MRLALAAAVAALVPAAALAQTYYDQPVPYPDDYQYQQQQSRSASDYARDSSDYMTERDEYAKDGNVGLERYTGRVGSTWRDADGRYCAWREVAREDADGYAAYKWVTVCRD